MQNINDNLDFINNESKMKSYAVTGTFHNSIICATSEGEARRIFHRYYKGESIIYCKIRDYKYFSNLAKIIAEY